MLTVPKVLAYARSLSDQLTQDMTWMASDSSPSAGYWQAEDHLAWQRIHSRATAALDFLRQYAGADSFWVRQATTTYDSNGGSRSVETGARAVGELLSAWVDQVEAGITEVVGAQAWAQTEIASTDLMTQVRRLLDDTGTHPAAAIVLCGAALEVALRATMDAHNLTLAENIKPSISGYSQSLRKAGLLTPQDTKDFEQVGGLRNAAAHGNLATLSIERAGLMEQQTNLLLRRLSDLTIRATGPETP
jgi:hypothetical protein